MRKITKLIAAASAAVMMLSAAACSSGAPANTVFSVDDLPGKSIGVQLGTTGDIYASDYEKEGSTIERYSKGMDAVQSLMQGKVDCVIIDEEPAKVFVEKNQGIKILEEPFEKEDYAICVSKKNAQLTKDINAALKTLKDNGTLDKIIGNYIGENTGTYKYESPKDVKRDNGKLVMATNAQFPPYEYYENDDKTVLGIDADMALAVADILGKELVIEDMEFDSIIASVQTGKADIGVAGMTVTEDRLKNVDFTDSYTTATQVIIVREK